MTRRCGCRRRRGPDCAAAAGIGVRTARHHFIDRCESTERCATDVVWCRWVAVTRISAPRKELSPASAGLFHASVSPRALCNQLCGSALGWRLAADDLAPRRQAPSDSLDQLSPAPGGAFSVAGCSFGRNHQPTERLGVGVVGLLHFGGIVQAQYGKT